MEWKYIDSFGKEKVPDVTVSKEDHVDSLLEHRFDFLEKGATVNSTSYYQLLRKNSPYLLNGWLVVWVLWYMNLYLLNGPLIKIKSFKNSPYP